MYDNSKKRYDVEYLATSDLTVYSVALVSKKFNQLRSRINLRWEFISKIYQYKIERQKRYSVRDVFYTDDYRLLQLRNLRDDLKSLFINGCFNSLELGYERLCNYYEINNERARSFALDKGPLEKFPFSFSVKPINYYQPVSSGDTIYTNQIFIKILFRLACDLFSKRLKGKAISAYGKLIESLISNLISTLDVEVKLEYIKKINDALRQSKNDRKEMQKYTTWDYVYIWDIKEKNYFREVEEFEFLSWLRSDSFKIYNKNPTLYFDLFEARYVLRFAPNLSYFYPNRDKYKEFENLEVIFQYIQLKLVNSLSSGIFSRLVTNYFDYTWLSDVIINYTFEGLDKRFEITKNASNHVKCVFKCYFILRDLYDFLYAESQSKLLCLDFRKNSFNLEVGNFASLIVTMLAESAIKVQRYIASSLDIEPKGFMKYLTNTSSYLKHLSKVSNLETEGQTFGVAQHMFKNFLTVKKDAELATNLLSLIDKPDAQLQAQLRA